MPSPPCSQKHYNHAKLCCHGYNVHATTESNILCTRIVTCVTACMQSQYDIACKLTCHVLKISCGHFNAHLFHLSILLSCIHDYKYMYDVHVCLDYCLVCVNLIHVGCVAARGGTGKASWILKVVDDEGTDRGAAGEYCSSSWSVQQSSECFMCMYIYIYQHAKCVHCVCMCAIVYCWVELSWVW